MSRLCWPGLLFAAALFPIMTPLAQVQDAPKSIVFLGDSLSAGYGLDNSTAESFPGLIAAKIQTEGLPYKVINAGVSGDTTSGGLGRIDWLLRKPIAVLVLELGGNDGLRGIPPEQTQKNLLAIVKKAREKNPDLKILIAGMRMPVSFGADYVAKYAATFPAVAEETHAALLPFLLEGVGGDEKLNQRDGIHPTAAGHRIIAEAVWKALKPLL